MTEANSGTAPTQPTEHDWERANTALIAKSLAELCYEEVMSAEQVTPGKYRVALASGAHYEFAARETIWTWLDIDCASVQRSYNGQRTAATDAAQFFVDAGEDLALSAATLGNLLHETANTLAADTALLESRRGITAGALAKLPDEKLQCLLDGHPKAIVNKGRIGWGAGEFAHYGTESGAGVGLVWLAVKPGVAVFGNHRDWDFACLLEQSMDKSELQRLARGCRSHGINWDEYLPLPVHPWQWERHIRHNYGGMIARGQIRYLGTFGDEYLPQVSLRTLSNLKRPAALHLKLPLTVLNTSCYRGIPGQYMACGPALSQWMQALCEEDPQLKMRETGVMQEVAGIHVPHPHHEQVAGTPYRYREMLGVTWRESPVSHCGTGERCLMAGALLQCDDHGRSVAGALIESSGLGPRDWLQKLFDRVVVPLYHLLCRYGVGLVAHGQNLTLMLRNDVVNGVLLKDFQGDLRLAEGRFPERDGLPPSADQVLSRLPAAHLTHDLYTGHFVSVLRYLSAQLERETGLEELDFYRSLAGVLRRYQEEARSNWPDMDERFASFDIFRPAMERVCINRVRLQQGYDDTGDRPVPAIGTPLENPLWLADHQPSEQGF